MWKYMNFHVLELKKTNKKFKNFIHDIPGGTSWNFHGIFFDPDLLNSRLFTREGNSYSNKQWE